jgi:hypothetical protein
MCYIIWKDALYNVVNSGVDPELPVFSDTSGSGFSQSFGSVSVSYTEFLHFENEELNIYSFNREAKNLTFLPFFVVYIVFAWKNLPSLTSDPQL